jgi:hypothetical protein
MNDILLRRICHLVAMTYAISVESVWETYLTTNSIDKTLEIISNIKQ